MTTTLSSPNTATLGMDGAASLTIAMFGKATIAFTSANDDVWPSFTVTNAQSKTYGPYGINMSVVITALDGSLTYQVNGGVPGFGYDADSNITSLVDAAGIPIISAVSALSGMTREQADDVTGMTGAVDVTAALQSVTAANKVVRFPRGKYKVSGEAVLTLLADSCWIMEGAEFVHDTSTGYTIGAANVDDWAILGKLTITGSGTTVGTARGISITNCSNFSVERPTVRTVKGIGIFVQAGSNTTRSRRGTIENMFVDQCYKGFQDDGGAGAEYLTLLNPRITRCTLFGLATSAGNLIVMGGHIVDNIAVGVYLFTGSNGSHGGFHGTNINHNGTYNLHANAVTNGETFTGCHFYEGAILLQECKGINISGGHLVCAVYNYKGASSGLNVIENMYCPGSYDIFRGVGANDGHDELVIRGCYGPGVLRAAGGIGTTGTSINSPAICYVAVSRAAGATQSLSTPANLIFPTETRDERNAYTGDVFTVPAGCGGMYRIQASLVFSGTVLNVTASYVNVKVDTASRFLALPGIYSPDKMVISISTDVYLNAAQTLEFFANIAGTAPVFGNSVWASSLSIELIA